jgi:hypothetical protein
MLAHLKPSKKSGGSIPSRNVRRGHVLAADAEADDAAGKHVDGHEDPPAAKQDRLATKQVHAPEAVFGLREESEPGGTRAVRMIGAAVC